MGGTPDKNQKTAFYSGFDEETVGAEGFSRSTPSMGGTPDKNQKTAFYSGFDEETVGAEGFEPSISRTAEIILNPHNSFIN